MADGTRLSSEKKAVFGLAAVGNSVGSDWGIRRVRCTAVGGEERRGEDSL